MGKQDKVTACFCIDLKSLAVASSQVALSGKIPVQQPSVPSALQKKLFQQTAARLVGPNGWVSITHTSCPHRSRLARGLGLFPAADYQFTWPSQGVPSTSPGTEESLHQTISSGCRLTGECVLGRPGTGGEASCFCSWWPRGFSPTWYLVAVFHTTFAR